MVSYLNFHPVLNVRRVEAARSLTCPTPAAPPPPTYPSSRSPTPQTPMTPMVSYLNLHAVLNVRRVEAARSLMRAKQQLAQLQQQQQQLQYQHQQRQQQHPHQQQQYQHQLQRLQRHKQQLENKINSLVLTKVPRVLLVGPTDSGKSTLARMLLCWAARQQWHPTYVDLDVAHSSVTVPGAVAATPVEAPLEANARSVEEAPLVLFYGHTNPSANLDLYRALVTAMADATDRRLGITPLGDGGAEEGGGDGGTAGAGAGAGREAAGGAEAIGAAAIGAAAIGAVPVEAAAAGMIANSMGWVDGAGYQLLLHSIDALRANVVLVLGQERLYSMLSEHYRSKAAAAAADGTPAGHAAAVEVVKLVRSGGAVSRASKFRQRLRQAVIKAYFYGPERQFSPHSSTASWLDYTVLRVGGGPQAPQSALPIGAARVSDPLRTAPVVLSRELEHHVLAVSHAKEEKDAVTGTALCHETACWFEEALVEKPIFPGLESSAMADVETDNAGVLSGAAAVAAAAAAAAAAADDIETEWAVHDGEIGSGSHLDVYQGQNSGKAEGRRTLHHMGFLVYQLGGLLNGRMSCL
ncbi:unnamed protein product [Closterium sp. Naga37s-1]|nr:unnamed protein product [Closterium sp. Naga37s-1]